MSNGNYLWISYFYSYLNEHGRAGFVMSSQASNAGRDEAKVKQKLIETGDVDIMIAIRSNFFYTRTVPCELWFLNRGKPATTRDKVLMVDARNIYHKVTRKINDFSPEQLQNILAITWLYREQDDRFLRLVGSHLANMLAEAISCFETKNDFGETLHPLPDFNASLTAFYKIMQPFLDTIEGEGLQTGVLQQLGDSMNTFGEDVATFQGTVERENTAWKTQDYQNGALKATCERLAGLSETCHNLVKQAA